MSSQNGRSGKKNIKKEKDKETDRQRIKKEKDKKRQTEISREYIKKEKVLSTVELCCEKSWLPLRRL